MRVLSKEELPDCGIMKIEGECYQDIIAILGRNGYVTEITTPPCKNLNVADHLIKYWKCVNDNPYQE